MKLDYNLFPCTKINSEWIKDLSRSSETVDYIEENMGTKLMVLCHREHFKKIPPNSREIKAKINAWDYRKLKNLHSIRNGQWDKKATNQMGKDISNNSSEKRLIPKIYKELIQLNNNQK